MSVYSELMNERLKPEQVYKPPKQTPEQRADNLKAIQKYIADAKAKKAAAEAKPETDVSHTEYEGPSLAEWIKSAAASIERRGTEGKCTPITKPGCTGRATALAKTFKKIGKKRDKAIVSKKEKQAGEN